MFSHCIFYIMRVYRTWSELERGFITEPETMFNFVCMSKIQVVMGEDVWHGVQHVCYPFSPGESQKSKLSFVSWGDSLCMSEGFGSFAVCSLCNTLTTALTSANIVLDGIVMSCSVSFFKTTGRWQANQASCDQEAAG